MAEVVELKPRQKDSDELNELRRSVHQMQDRAMALDLKFLAYLLGLAKIEIATKFEEANR